MNFPVLSSLYQQILLLLPFAAVESFDYDNPNRWGADYPTCNGRQQSPIGINTLETIPRTYPPLALELYDYTLIDFLTVTNNGHTVQFPVPDTFVGERPFITGGPLNDIYVAEQVHFHWGSPNQKGSEHAINGRRYDMEMHIVHRNRKYADVSEAINNKDGLSVLGIFFKVVPSDNVYYPGLNTLYDVLGDIRRFNTSATTGQLISLGSLLGDINRNNFVTYSGSLTTPPCAEVVTWIVFPEVIPIARIELQKFWRMLDPRGRPLINNYRPLQAKFGRNVYRPRIRYSTDIFENVIDNSLV